MTATLPAAKLGAWMQAHIEGFAEPFTISQFAGGQSNPTYRIDARSGGYVLRRKPAGLLLASAHAIDREYRMICALRTTAVPVPRTHCLCTDIAVIGSEFYIMDLVEGRCFRDGALPELQPAQRTTVYYGMIDTLAALHAIDPEAIGLGDYGRPGNFYERQVSRWTRQYRAAQTDAIPDMERMIAWLPRTLPPQHGSCIVHGDYRIDNLLFAPDGSGVRAVLDWELSTLGDPLADLTYLLMNWIEGRQAPSSVAALDLAALGIPGLDAMAARYCENSGLGDLPALDWYFAFNFFRLACIVQGIRKRVLDGTASSPHAASVAGGVERLAVTACECGPGG